MGERMDSSTCRAVVAGLRGEQGELSEIHPSFWNEEGVGTAITEMELQEAQMLGSGPGFCRGLFHRRGEASR